MALKDITRESVLEAVAKFIRLGESRFFKEYGFGPAHEYHLIVNGREYPSKAIVGVAHRLLFPHKKPLKLYGGKATIQPLLEKLGFEVRVTPSAVSKPRIHVVRPDETVSAIEGTLTEARYWKRSRSSKLRDEAFQKANGICCVCDTDFSKLLDGRGVRVLQVHHREQLSSLDEPRVNTTEDLAVVCANCHMLLHLDPKKAMSIEELRRMLERDRRRGMNRPVTFADVLEAADHLDADAQAELVEVLSRRRAERGRERVVATVEQVHREFAEGACRPMTAADAIHEATS